MRLRIIFTLLVCIVFKAMPVEVGLRTYQRQMNALVEAQSTRIHSFNQTDSLVANRQSSTQNTIPMVAKESINILGGIVSLFHQDTIPSSSQISDKTCPYSQNARFATNQQEANQVWQLSGNPITQFNAPSEAYLIPFITNEYGQITLDPVYQEHLYQQYINSLPQEVPELHQALSPLQTQNIPTSAQEKLQSSLPHITSKDTELLKNTIRDSLTSARQEINKNLVSHPDKATKFSKLESLYKYAKDSLEKGNFTESLKATSALSAIIESVPHNKTTQQSPNQPHYGVNPQTWIDTDSENDLIIDLSYFVGKNVAEGCVELVSEVIKDLKTIGRAARVIDHILNKSESLVKIQELLLNKRIREKGLSQNEQLLLHKIDDELAYRDAVCGRLTANYAVKHGTAFILEKGAKYALFLGPQRLGVAPLALTLFKTFKISSNFAEKALAKIENLSQQAKAGSAEKLSLTITECLAPIDNKIETQLQLQQEYRQAILLQAQQKLIDVTYDHLVRGELEKAVNTASTSIIINAIISNKESTFYSPEVNQLLQRMLKNNPRCNELAENHIQNRSFNAAIAGHLVDNVKNTKHNVEPHPRVLDCLLDPCLLELAKIGPPAQTEPNALLEGVLLGVENLSTEVHEAAENVATLQEFAKLINTDPFKLFRAATTVLTEDGIKQVTKQALNSFLWSPAQRESLSRFNNKIKQEIGDLFLNWGGKITKKETPAAKAVSNLFQELTVAFSSNENSQIASAISDIILEFAIKEEVKGSTEISGLLLNIAQLIENNGTEATSFCRELTTSIAQSIMQKSH